MCAIDAATVKRSEAQLRSRWAGTTIPPTSTAPSTSTPSFSTSSVTFEDIMAQLVRMDARLDTLSDELCQANTRVSRIAQQGQSWVGGFVISPPPTLEASKDEDNDSDANASDDDEDDDANSSSADEISI